MIAETDASSLSAPAGSVLHQAQLCPGRCAQARTRQPTGSGAAGASGWRNGESEVCGFAGKPSSQVCARTVGSARREPVVLAAPLFGVSLTTSTIRVPGLPRRGIRTCSCCSLEAVLLPSMPAKNAVDGRHGSPRSVAAHETAACPLRSLRAERKLRGRTAPSNRVTDDSGWTSQGP